MDNETLLLSPRPWYHTVCVFTFNPQRQTGSHASNQAKVGSLHSLHTAKAEYISVFQKIRQTSFQTHSCYNVLSWRVNYKFQRTNYNDSSVNGAT
jgi:hypothetical protein